METASLQYSTIGDIIRQYRNKADLTQSQLAGLSGVSTGYISKIETGEVERPSFNNIHSVALALHVPIDEIIKPYIELEHKFDVLFGILHEVVNIENTDLIVKVASACLHSKDMDSMDAIERLYHFVDQEMNSDSLKLALYDLIIRQSRGHGINKFVAKALLQKYLIERNDVTKLQSTYDSGRYVLHYVDFLSAEERVTLYYKLGVHAYHLRLFHESIELCSNNITEDIPVSLYKAESALIQHPQKLHVVPWSFDSVYLVVDLLFLFW
ncbi:helix-turn-helix domain-containing protein [Paenibacillus popilliae]|nr:helix-turn-helix transcriptional regulator [Paenibacillus popilliae]